MPMKKRKKKSSPKAEKNNTSPLPARARQRVERFMEAVPPENGSMRAVKAAFPASAALRAACKAFPCGRAALFSPGATRGAVLREMPAYRTIARPAGRFLPAQKEGRYEFSQSKHQLHTLSHH